MARHKAVSQTQTSIEIDRLCLQLLNNFLLQDIYVYFQWNTVTLFDPCQWKAVTLSNTSRWKLEACLVHSSSALVWYSSAESDFGTFKLSMSLTHLCWAWLLHSSAESQFCLTELIWVFCCQLQVRRWKDILYYTLHNLDERKIWIFEANPRGVVKQEF